MVAVTYSAGLFGIDGYSVTCEVAMDSDFGLFSMVGLPDAAVREAKDRITPSVARILGKFPEEAMTVNLAPASRRKEGSGYDLAIFTALMVCTGQVSARAIRDVCLIGELSLTGAVRPVCGVLSMAMAAAESGRKILFVPAENAGEAAVVPDVTVYGVSSVDQLLAHLQGRVSLTPAPPTKPETILPVFDVDFSEVKGQDKARRAMVVAAAGGHNMLLIGPPGSGKSMMARRLPTILPTMTFPEMLETTRIHSAAGLLRDGASLVTERPFRSPHHTMSSVSLAGGGKVPMPGEISLAHGGVLFLDELPEYNRDVIEALRQPLEDRQVTITRAAGRVTYPAAVQLVSAMNPCKCGYYGSRQRPCSCTKKEIETYLGKISGPLLDRIDIQVEMPALEYAELADGKPGESSALLRERVEAAREKAAERFRAAGSKTRCNAQMTPGETQAFCKPDAAGAKMLESAFRSLGLSARGYDRVLRLARTVADLSGAEAISASHIAEAIQMRALDRKYWK